MRETSFGHISSPELCDAPETQTLQTDMTLNKQAETVERNKNPTNPHHFIFEGAQVRARMDLRPGQPIDTDSYNKHFWELLKADF